MKGKLYKCKICPHQYSEKKWGQKCGVWCATHNSCNTEIIKHAVNLKEWHIKFAEQADKK